MNIKFVQLKLFGIVISSQNCVGKVATEFYPQILFFIFTLLLSRRGQEKQGETPTRPTQTPDYPSLGLPGPGPS